MTDQISREMSESLLFENITISRLDGIGDGFAFEALSPGINLIHGPNGIGKSRTALALQSLIWPSLVSNRASLIGNVEVSGDAWNIELDLGKATYQKNSASVSNFANAIPPQSHFNRYLLTLQDLLRVYNNDFALEIQKEASGGYDLERVRSVLKIQSNQRGFRPSKSIKPLHLVRQSLYDLRQHETALREQESTLNQLRTEHASAISASDRLGELEAARTYKNACSELEAARLVLNTFPASLARTLGTEYHQARALIQKLEETQEEHRLCDIRISNLVDEIQSAGFSETIPSLSATTSLRKRLADLQRQEEKILQAESSIGEYTNQIAVLRDRLNQGISEKQMESLDEKGLRALALLSRKWEQAHNTLLVQDQLAQWLGTSHEWDRESLRIGVDLLSQHLRTQNSDVTNGRKQLVIFFVIGAAIIIIVEALLLFTSLSQYSLLLALAALPLLWLAFTMKSDDNEVELNQIQSQYSALGLGEPTNWTPESTRRSLLELQKLAAQAELDNQREIRWSSLQDNRERAAAEFRAVGDERESFTRTFGIDLAEQFPESLEILAKALEEWHRETDQLRRAMSRKQTLVSDRSSMLGTISADLKSHGLATTIHDATSAHAGIEELAVRIGLAQGASAALENTHQRLEKEIMPRTREIEEQIESLYGELELEPDDLHGLMVLCEQVDVYKESRTSVDQATVAVTIAHSRLRQGCDDENITHEAITLAMTRETELANSRDELQANISRITTEINQAHHQTRIEEEVANEQVAAEILSEGRNQDYSSAADRLVFELVQNRNREVNRPPVFRHANDLFISFTNGAYHLGLDEGNAEFTALEAETGRSVMLDQLSSGTRVQLLLAIRLAFIQASEHGIQLPLMLDETLGNTDDIRAKAIIDATIEIASRGRQVFYFTAQQDEIGKWSSALSDLDEPLDSIVLDLASIRAKASATETTDYTWDHSAISGVTIPEGADHNSLFDLFGVPGIDFYTANLLEIDLWYVITDVSASSELRKRDIRRWGQYLNLHSGGYLRGVWTEALHERAVARAHIIEEFLLAWRVGRPERLTASHLKDSNLITPRFWDEVVLCAASHNWDGTALIGALESGEVRGFRGAVTETLSEWLNHNGFITDVEPLEDETIRARVISSMHYAVQSSVISHNEIDELILNIVRQEPARIGT